MILTVMKKKQKLTGINYYKKDLAQYSLPAEIVFKESFPKTLVGKVTYTELIKEEEDE